MSSVQVKIDESGIKNADRILRLLGTRAPKAIMRAMNRAIQGVKTDASREVRKEYNVRDRDVKETFTAHKASPENPSAIASFKGRAIRFGAFSPLPKEPPAWKGVPVARRKPKAGVSLRIKKSRREVMAGTFMARMSTGHIGVFRRGTKEPLEDTVPIYEPSAPSIPHFIDNEEIKDRLQTAAIARFNKTLDHETDRILKRIGAK